MAEGAEIIGSRRVLDGRLIKVDVDEVRENHQRDVRRREVVRAMKASAVVPVADDGRVVLVRQYRYPVDKRLWEIPAGMREDGEDPAECARRELAEETGYRAARIEYLTGLHTTPGFCDEVIDLFVATGLTAGEPDPDPQESFEVREFSVEDIRALIAGGEIVDAKTIAGVLIVAAGLGTGGKGE